MAFEDPITFTINAVGKSLHRVNTGDRWSSYELVADGLVAKISHLVKKRASRMVRLDRTVMRADPLTGLNTPVTDSVWIVYNAPAGVVVPLAEQKHMLDTVGGWITNVSNQDQFLNGES